MNYFSGGVGVCGGKKLPITGGINQVFQEKCWHFFGDFQKVQKKFVSSAADINC